MLLQFFNIRHHLDISSPSICLSLCILPIPWELGEGNVPRHLLNIRKSTPSLCAQQDILLPGMEPRCLDPFYFSL